MFYKTVKNSMLVVFLCLNLLLFKLTVFHVSVRGVSAITEQQRQEIERLRSELSEALEKDNVNGTPKDIIVQPVWTQDKSGKTESVTVKVNAQNRNEVAALRAEIEQAVSKDSYATEGVTNTQDIKYLEASFMSLVKGKKALLSAKGVPSKSVSPHEEHLGAGQEHNEDKTKAPNTITANLYDDSEIDIRKLQRLEVRRRRNREVLVLKYIEEDFSFNLGAEVKEWKNIVHAGHEYIIGRRIRDLLIVRKKAEKYERAMEVDIGHVITTIETYTYWNLEQEQQEGVILVATADKLMWYRANQETTLIELYWEWMVGSIITGLAHFALDSKNFLTISSNQSFLADHYALNIYQFNLEYREFWIAQRLQLDFPCEEVTVLDSGRDVILAVPQSNTAKIYTFNPHEAPDFHIRFEFKKLVAAEGISVISGFKMGGRSYLAVTGYQPQILLYQEGDFIPKTFLGGNFGLVELFFPIPVRSYRDDLILLVQHRVDFSTHSLTVVETLIWDGEAFETSIPVPCHLGKHVVYGVGCMLDLHRDEGLKGASLLRRGDEVSLLVPRYKAESGLFRFHTELLAKNSELLDLQEIFDFLRAWVKEHEDLIAEAEAFLQIPHEELINLKPDSLVIESLNSPEFEFNGNVAEIYVNDYRWTTKDSDIDLNLIIRNIEDLEGSLNSGRQRRNLDEIEHDNLDFDEVTVEELEVEKLNGQQYFIQNGELNFDGLINFSDLEVLEKLTNLNKRQLNDEDFNINGDLEFDKINGVDWLDIKNNLVFITQNQNFKDLEVRGDIFVESLLTINTLNTLNFPDDYLLTNGPSASTVTAEKHFANILTVSSVDTNGFVNGKNSMDAITLTDPQEWRGMPIFKQLEIAKIFELHGQVQGRDQMKLPQNPTLQETNIIEANCHFSEIMINGTLVLKGYLDDKPLSAFLKDVILKPENPADEVLVPSLKSFDMILFPIDFDLESRAINKIPVEDFVTIHTYQTLNLSSLEGYVYFYNLTINGSYDGVRIEDVLKEVIILDQPIDLSTTQLVFPEKIKASSVTILERVNNNQIKDNLQTLQEDLNMAAAEFENLQSHQADFSSDILGLGKLNNRELHSFINGGSWHEPPFKGNIFLNELILENGIITDELHGIAADFLFEFLNQISELPDMVVNGQIEVDHITVTGDIQLYKLNGLLFDEEIQLTSIKLQHPNFLSTKLSFRKPLNIIGRLNVLGDFRGNNFPNLIDDIVIRATNTCIDITAPKGFSLPVKVLQNTEIETLNGISMSNVASKIKHNSFDGSVHLKGNLVAENLNLLGNINDFNWQDIQNLLYFDAKLESFVLKNTIDFNNPLFLEDLTVMGDLNEVKNLTDFFGNLIYKNKLCSLNGKNTFTGRVSINQGARISYLNGQDIFNLLNNIVFIRGPQPVIIQAPITFKDTIHATKVQVKKSLSAEYISGCSLKEWMHNTLRVDRDENIPPVLQFASGSIDGNALLVNFINDKDLSRIITLNTPQTFNESVKISQVILNGFISSKGWVNNVDLENEFNNTLMTYGEQHIFTPLSIQTITVLRDLNVKCLVNTNKDLKDVATLQEDLIFESSLYFQSIYSPQVMFKDLVSGINFNKWFESALKNNYPGTQYITGSWSTKCLTVRKGPKELQYFGNIFEPGQYYSSVRLARNGNNKSDENDEICPLVSQILQDIDKKPLLIKHVKEYFNMDFGKELKSKNESLHKLFDVKSNQEQLLLVNLKYESFIYKWLPQENIFIFKTSFASGPINEIKIIPAFNNSKTLRFITNCETAEDIACNLKGLKKWKMQNDSVVLESDLPWSADLHFKSEGNNSSLWALDNETIQEMDLNYKIKEKWQLPVEQNKTRYRFVLLKKEHEILLTNGEELFLISKTLSKKSAKSFFYTQEPKVDNLQLDNTESLLKPNSTVTRSLVFADFKPVIERILKDLNQRLNQQVIIIQLSIPESDLIDEHLFPDFTAIKTELQSQTIYDSKVINISLNTIMLPADPAQVLAARVVQITWPVVMEIEKIYSYFKANESHDHPCIRKFLGFLINDVLMLANTENNSTDVGDNKLNHVIERIREFEKNLKTFLKVYYDVKPESETSADIQIQESASNRELKLFSQNQTILMFEKKSFPPGFTIGEILSFEVGSVTNPHSMLAISNTNASVVGSTPGIYIYREGFTGQLFQVISAEHTRSMQQLRIKQETLLLYVQECCQVKIFKYRGTQGFTAFAEINRDETIKQILTTSLPSDQRNFKYFLILLLENDIKFYEFVLEGYDSSRTPSASLIPLNCL